MTTNLVLSDGGKNLKSFFINSQNGFTTIEMLAVIAVMAILSAVLIFDHRSFQDRLELSNDAQEVVFNVRDARVTALSVRETMDGEFEDRFRRGRGLYFSTDQDNAFSFIYFIDLDGEDRYSYPSSTIDCGNAECVRSISFQGGNRVSDICILFEGGFEECGFLSVEVFFRRPSTDAKITFEMDSGSDNRIGAVIKLESPRGIKKDVVIEDTGMASALSVY